MEQERRKRFREHRATAEQPKTQCNLQLTYSTSLLGFLQIAEDISVTRILRLIQTIQTSFRISSPGDTPSAHQEIEIIRYAASQKLAREIDGLWLPQLSLRFR
ncbi:PREDICTED: uncharacterized protein LOC105450339 isoform X3 [Wasmannia auropunctata]|uniref:uncharacterized protein LOC105450339 isoform X3 n=1 Tax=Wasmannia auropunctata TaxID=64793 RepID=UPI0005F08987|nr:PREDICTED: uncharacterized protein LOC105450339 isoform X3 [Wasmannia auropunctata]